MGAVGLLLVGLGSLALWAGFRLQRAEIEQAEHDLELQAYTLAALLREAVEEAEEDHRPVRAYIEAFAGGIGGRVRIVGPSLRVLASSEGPTAPPVLDPPPPEVLSALQGTEQHHIRPDPRTGELTLFVGAPLLSEHGEVVGALQVSALDRCRISVGRVLRLEGDRAKVLRRPLEMREGRLALGPPRVEAVRAGWEGRPLLPDLRPGDQVALHWGWVCHRLTPQEVRHLTTLTLHHLRLANERLATL